MAQLDDDIARVAAMRGRSVASVEAAAAERRAAERADTGRLERIVDILLGWAPGGARDMEYHDILPASVRQAIAEIEADTTRPISAAGWAWALHEWRDTAGLIEAVAARLRSR